MTISVRCKCQKRIIAKDVHAGRTVKCPACGEALAIPHAVAPEGVKPVASDSKPSSLPSRPRVPSPAIESNALPPDKPVISTAVPIALAATQAQSRGARQNNKVIRNLILLVGAAFASVVVASVLVFVAWNTNRIRPQPTAAVSTAGQDKTSTKTTETAPAKISEKSSKQVVPKPLVPPRTDTPEILKLLNVLEYVNPLNPTAGDVSGLDIAMVWVGLKEVEETGQEAGATLALINLIEQKQWSKSGSDERVLQNSLIALAKMGPKARASLPVLSQAANHRNEAIRRAAVAALKSVKTTEMWIADIKSTDAYARSMACSVLAKKKTASAAAAQALADVVEKDSGEMQKNALQALRFMGASAEPAVATLVRFLGRRDEWGKDDVNGAAAVLALAEIGSAAAPALPALKQLRDEPERKLVSILSTAAVSCIDGNDREGLTRLITHLESGDFSIQLACLMGLDVLGTRAASAETALERIAKDPNPITQFYATHTLAVVRGNDAEAERILKDAAKDSNSVIRQLAKTSLEEWQIKHSKPE